MKKIILASKSERRQQLLKQIGLTDFIVRESDYQEDMSLDKKPAELAKFLAMGKAKEVGGHYEEGIVVAGDTMVFLADEVIGKPKDKNEAVNVLTKFSGKRVGLISGLALIDVKTGKAISDYGIGWVKFRKLTAKEIADYVSSEKDILNFAGGFGLLNKGAILAEAVEGDFFSIIGLPLAKLYLGLKKLGVDILKL